MLTPKLVWIANLFMSLNESKFYPRIIVLLVCLFINRKMLKYWNNCHEIYGNL